MLFYAAPGYPAPSSVYPALAAAAPVTICRCIHYIPSSIIDSELAAGSPELEAERAHLVCRIKNAIFSVVISLAAMHRSPSFSRPSSSITTTNCPRLYAATASSTGSNSKVEDEDDMVVRGRSDLSSKIVPILHYCIAPTARTHRTSALT